MRYIDGDTLEKVRSVLSARFVLALVLLVPLVGGAVVGGILNPTAPRSSKQVAIVSVSTVAPPSSDANSATASLSKEVQRVPGYSWQPQGIEEARSGLANGDLFAVVLIPVAVTSSPQGHSQVIVTPGQAATSADASELARLVTASLARAGANETRAAVSRARIDLNVAFLTANGIKGAVKQAEAIFADALASVDSLIRQSDPLISNAQLLLSGLQENTRALEGVSANLDRLAKAVQGIEITVGDLQRGTATARRGAVQASRILIQTEGMRSQLIAASQTVTTALRATRDPAAATLAQNFDNIVRTVTDVSAPRRDLAAADVGFQVLGEQLSELGPLLGTTVGPNTNVSDLLISGVVRLQSVEKLLSLGNETVQSVLVQLRQAKVQLPQTKQSIRDQLDRFRTVSEQLVVSLGSGIDGLPTGTTGLQASEVELSSLQNDAEVPQVSVFALAVAAMAGGGLIATWAASAPSRRKGGRGAMRTRLPALALLLVTPALLAAAAQALAGSQGNTRMGGLLLGTYATTLLSFAVLMLVRRAATGSVVLLAILLLGVLLSAGNEVGPAGLSEALKRLTPVEYVVQVLAAGPLDAAVFPCVILASIAATSSLVTVMMLRTTRELTRESGT